SWPHRSRGCRRGGGSLRVDPDQLHFEDEGGARRDHAARPAIAVAEMRGDDELALAAHAHRADAFVPALDDAAAPDRKHERLAAVVRRIELLAALEPARVVHPHRVAGLRPRPGALHQLHVAKPGRGLDDLLIHDSYPSRRPWR